MLTLRSSTIPRLPPCRHAASSTTVRRLCGEDGLRARRGPGHEGTHPTHRRTRSKGLVPQGDGNVGTVTKTRRRLLENAASVRKHVVASRLLGFRCTYFGIFRLRHTSRKLSSSTVRLPAGIDRNTCPAPPAPFKRRHNTLTRPEQF